MNYETDGFRSVYKKLCIFLPCRQLSFLGAIANEYKQTYCTLMYGYYDRQAGISFKAISLVDTSSNNYRYIDLKDDSGVTVRLDMVKNCEFFPIPTNEYEIIFDIYSNRLKNIDRFYEGRLTQDILQTRSMNFIDNCRHEVFIDDIKVWFFKEGYQPEICWVRLTGTRKGTLLKGILLNEPNIYYGCHQNNEILTRCEMVNNEIYCFYAGLA